MQGLISSQDIWLQLLGSRRAPIKPSFQQRDRVPSPGQISCQRTSAGPRTDYDVIERLSRCGCEQRHVADTGSDRKGCETFQE
jgi:hypothetical protein